MTQAISPAISGYQIRARLGQGAMGQVYKIVSPDGNGFAALKLLKPHPGLVSKLGMPRLAEQFFREFTAVSNLRHPNVVKVLNFEEKEKNVYFLMEYFPRNLGMLMGESYFADQPSRILRVCSIRRYHGRLLCEGGLPPLTASFPTDAPAVGLF